MKRISRAMRVWLGVLLAGLSLGLAPARADAPAAPDLEVFVSAGCPHCAAAKLWLARLHSERPDLAIEVADVTLDPGARERLRALASERGVGALGVPAFRIGDRLLVGWQGEETTGREILGLLARASAAPPAAPPAGSPDEVRVPWLGTLSVSRLGLPLFTLAIGLLDGFNPCAMWALLLILALLVRLRDRGRMLAIGGTFVVVGGVLYFAFLAAWLELFLLIGFSRVLQAALGVVALAIGALNLKDVFAFRRGPSLGIPESAKPGIYARMRRVVSAPSLPLALLAVALLSAVVNVFELVCTAGLPTLYTQVLASHALPRAEYYGYLLLYVAAYVFDDGVALALATITLSQARLQESGGRWLKLVSGAALLALGLVLLLRPSWLT